VHDFILEKMCVNNEYLTFCTCSERDPKASDYYDTEIYYTWLLTRYIGRRESSRRGKILKPSEDLGKGLTLPTILGQLNSNSIYFDFDYHPNDLDCLSISNNLKHPFYEYFSLIYKNDIWQEGSNPAFVSSTKTIAHGKISRKVDEPEKTRKWLVSRDKLSLNQLFDKLLNEKNIQEQWRFITALVNRFPQESFDKALDLSQSNSKTHKIHGFRLMQELYESEYKLDQVKSFLFEKVESESDKEIIEILIYSLTSNPSLLRGEQIISLLSIKERGDNFKILLLDELLPYNHKLVIDFLLELCRDNNLGVQQKAIMELSCNDVLDSPKIRKELWLHVESKNKKISQYCIFGLALRRDYDIKPILEKEFQYIDNAGSLILKAIESGKKKIKPHLQPILDGLIGDTKILSGLLIDLIDQYTNALDDEY